MEYPCTLCNRKYGSKPSLEQHIRDSPTHKNTFYCEACQSFLPSKKALKNHKNNFRLYQSCSKPAPEPTKPVPERREFFEFPALHPNVTQAVLPEVSSTWYNTDTENSTPRREYLTRIMGTFKCNNTACKRKGWGSRKVPIEILGYARNGYSAFVYNQKCTGCSYLGTFTLDEDSYIERVAYRIKKWAGVRMEPMERTRKKGPPHKSDFCEGCKRGKCTDGREWDPQDA